MGYRSIARKYGISQPSLRRLYGRFLDEGFFKGPGWETGVMDNGLLSDSTDNSDGD